MFTTKYNLTCIIYYITSINQRYRIPFTNHILHPCYNNLRYPCTSYLYIWLPLDKSHYICVYENIYKQSHHIFAYTYVRENSPCHRRKYRYGQRIEIDLTTDENSSPIEIKDSITIIAVPVYAGRVAPIALQRLRRLRGNNAPAILITVYGNRDYEDALVELRDETIQLGFTPLAAGAFIGEHSYSRPNMPIAEGRPDITDLQTAEQFGKDCLTKLEKDEILSDFT